MLIKREVLDRIVSGEIDLVFRRWRKPTVKAGGTLRTSVGMLAVDAVDVVSRSSIAVADAQRAGYSSKAELLRDLDARSEGDIHRISVHVAGADPRVALRENSDLSDEDIAELATRLGGLDRRSARGPWTQRFLELLEANPQVRAQDLADGIGLDKATFKNDVSKLKRLGLTISFSPGYELSPRGRRYLEVLRS